MPTVEEAKSIVAKYVKVAEDPGDAFNRLLRKQTGGKPPTAADIQKVRELYVAEQQAQGKGGDKAPDDPDKLLDMDSTSGVLADVFSPMGWGGSRAGRAAMMSRAAGKETPFNVQHPEKSNIISSLIGAGLGGLAGAGVGGLAGGLVNGKRMVAPGGLAGAGIGMGIGSIAGLLINVLRRRGSMRGIKKDYGEARDAGELDRDVEPTEYSTLDKAISPLSGAWRFGEAQTAKALKGQDQDYTPLQHAANASGYIPYVGAARLPLGWAQHASADDTFAEAKDLA